MEINGDVALGVVEFEGKYLLMRRSEENSSSGKWTFPGGRVEEDESTEDAVKREIKEETGLDTEVVREGDHFINEGELGFWRVHPFLLSSESKEVEIGREHDRHEWIEISELEGFDTLGETKAPGRLDLR